MYDKVKQFIRETQMIAEKDHIIAGVSGGPDSVCLLDLLVQLSKEYRLNITAVHVNHRLRGEEADADEAYTEALCKSYGVLLRIYRIDVKRVREERGLSPEEAGREVRREVFHQVLKQEHGTKIALAHHRNDNAETMMLNMARGTGLKGLGGIRPVNGSYIRPLLCVERKEIEEYLNKKNIKYCMDASNAGDNYTRNRVRNHMIPYIEKEINEKAVLHLSELAEQMAELNLYVESQTQKYYKSCARKEGGDVLLCQEKYGEVPEAIRPYLLKRALTAVSDKEKDIGLVHLRDLNKLWGMRQGKRLSLPHNMEALRCARGIRIVKKGAAGKELEEASMKYNTELRVIENNSILKGFPENPYTKWFDYDIIKNTVIIRNRQAGDFITIDRYGNTQKIKKYLINAKVPREKRGDIMMAADGSEIMWIVGYRQSQRYQVTETTRRILEIKIHFQPNGGKDDVRED